MPVLVFLLAAYAIGLLVMRSSIAAHLNSPAGIIWFDILVFLLGSAAIWLFAQHRSLKAIHVSVKLFGLVFLAITVTLVGLFQQDLKQPPGPIAAVALTAPVETYIKRKRDGHFRTIARIDGTNVGMLIDTGASLVLLRHDDAMRLGIDPQSLDFSVPLTTAGGQSRVAPYVFEAIQIGDVLVHNVAGAVAEPGQLYSSLLGMSFIEQLTETIIRENEMVLRK